MTRLLILTLSLLFFVNCGGRTPSPKTAHRVIVKQFEKYGKRFKESDFGKHPIQKVEIYEVREIQKNLAEVEAYAALKDGLTYRVRVTLEKKPFGWKYLAWENLGER